MKQLRLPYLVPGIGLAALVWSCGPDSTPTGVLGNGQFTYVCPPGNVDVGCNGATDTDGAVFTEDAGPSGGGTTNIPKVIAVGAAFSVTYASFSGTGVVQGASGALVTPASPRLASVSGDQLIARREGYLALLAESSTAGAVEDFIFVRFSPIASVTPTRPAVSIGVGETETLSVTAKDASLEPLAGQLQCKWTASTGAALFDFEGAQTGASVQIRARVEGTAHVIADCGGVAAEISVDIGPGSGDGGPPDGGGEAGEAGSDAGHEGGDAALKEGGSHG